MTDLTKLSVSGVHAWAYGKDLHPSEVWEKAFNELVRRLDEAEKRDQFNYTDYEKCGCPGCTCVLWK